MDETNGAYNNKVDIWAIGCILYEVIFRQKAFSNDFAICQYYLNHRFGERIKIPFDMAFDMLTEEPAKVFVTNAIHKMLEIDAFQRPAAKALGNEFQFIIDSNGVKFPPVGDIEYPFADLEIVQGTSSEGKDCVIYSSTFPNLH